MEDIIGNEDSELCRNSSRQGSAMHGFNRPTTHTPLVASNDLRLWRKDAQRRSPTGRWL